MVWLLLWKVTFSPSPLFGADGDAVEVDQEVAAGRGEDADPLTRPLVMRGGVVATSGAELDVAGCSADCDVARTGLGESDEAAGAGTRAVSA